MTEAIEAKKMAEILLQTEVSALLAAQEEDGEEADRTERRPRPAEGFWDTLDLIIAHMSIYGNN
jgi:hypothetical protein